MTRHTTGNPVDGYGARHATRRVRAPPISHGGDTDASLI